MNKDLQSILDFIQQSQHLNDEEKKSILKSLKDANKELEITSFKLDRTEKVKRTTAILLEETIEELEKKRKAVEAQNKELEIESSLERVRTVAMSMNKPDDMLDVCRTISEQLELLKVKEIRNVQTAIFYKEKGTYMNYEYYAKHNKTFITETTYTNHEIHEDFANKMLKGNGEFMVAHIKGDEVKAWIDYQKTTNVFIDDYLYAASSLNYYWYSLGPVALGISTYDPLSEEETILFKRFLKVFELSYRRYLDIELAIKQAKEARIETALERVRAVAMAMRKPDDLLDVCKILFEEFHSLGFSELRNSMINIYNDNNGSLFNYDYSESVGKTITHFIYNTHTTIDNLVKNTRGANDAFIEYAYTGKELDEWREFRKKSGEADDARLDNAEAIYYYFYSIGTGSIGISTFSTIGEEKLEVLKRFRNVFNLSYQRYTDLALAETQAREAQIEASLERMRAAAMSLRKSEELITVCEAMYKELTVLGFANIRNAQIAIKNESRQSYFISEYSDHAVTVMKEAPYNSSPLVKLLYEEMENSKEALYQKEFSGKEFDEWRAWRKNVGAAIDGRIEQANSMCFYLYSFGKGYLGISTFNAITKNQLEVLKRFKNVFELSYTRYIDVAQAEAQAREAQIELALERVRARTMAMQKSEELAETISILFKQLLDLGIKSTQMRTCAITTLKSDEPIGECWITKPDGEIIPQSFMVPYNETSAYQTIYAAWKSGEKFLVINLSGDALIQHLNFLKKYAKIPTQQFQALPNQPRETFTHAMFFSQGYLFIISNEPLPEYHEIFKRFGSIFQQTYTRFLDLKNAEAQARESQIQLALERVRARTMAMQKSDELSETVFILFQQFKQLGENPDQATIGIINEEEWVIEYWVTMYGNQTNRVYKFPIDEPNVTNRIYKAWKEQKKSLVIELSGKELFDFANFRESMGGAAYNPEEKKRVINVAFFSKGIINVQSNESRSAESILLLERFAAVFEQTYTRFLDLKKAESQARESQIQLALERVRARTMAMQDSNELPEAANLLFQQMQALGMPAWSAGYCIWDDDERGITLWMSSEGVMQPSFHTPVTEDPSFIHMREAHERGDSFHVETVGGDELVSHYKYMRTLPGISEVLDSIINAGHALPIFQIFHCAYFSQGFLLFITYEPVPEAHDIFKRFGKVFEQTYTRFLDLQKAEAQARESQIEASLERVRSRSMAMQKSEELKEVIQVVYDQFVHLNMKVEHTGFIMDYKEREDMFIWLADKHGVPFQVSIPYFDCAHWNSFRDAKEKGSDFFVNLLSFEEKNKFYQDLFKLFPVPDEAKEYYFNCDGLAVSTVLLDSVGLYIENFSGTPYTVEENKTLMRFGKVFQQTYTRFNDLQKAEVQALEAIKRSSVDRVRAEIASMRTTNDLERITPLIWNELTVLGIPFIRCGVFIMDEEQQKVQTFLYTEGKTIASFTSTYANSNIITEALPYWHRKEIYKTHWDEAAFLEQAKSLVEQGAITSGEKYLTEHRPTDLYLHFLPFLQGMLYVGDAAPLSDDRLQLVQALAEAFATAYARYEDFNKLEAAKQTVEKTLVDLKQTQAQLLQSEKMASLGELTAGIAHEIQNPLNFVNNFSEVSNELIVELQEERHKEQGTRDEELENDILNDIAQNLEKINHHGKRADAIVKGMLQHSRSSTGVKEPTKINALADEYLRLAFHGLRAKEKSFNAILKTDFDNTIEKINIVPQDIGRVLLNLYNNAFYAVSERRKVEGVGYEPTISVNTKKSENKIYISVSDNGNGIPQKVVDKIFQPFFTTKPTGQGTGLGLSLVYDIIKAHGGEIKVETKEGEGSEFIIQLPFV